MAEFGVKITGKYYPLNKSKLSFQRYAVVSNSLSRRILTSFRKYFKACVKQFSVLLIYFQREYFINLLLYIFQHFSLHASENVIKLAADPKVQHFLNNIPMKESLGNKEIYQPGCLRKV